MNASQQLMGFREVVRTPEKIKDRELCHNFQWLKARSYVSKLSILIYVEILATSLGLLYVQIAVLFITSSGYAGISKSEGRREATWHSLVAQNINSLGQDRRKLCLKELSKHDIIYDVFWTSHVHSIYVLCLRGMMEFTVTLRSLYPDFNFFS